MIEVITERFIHTNILARQRVKQKTPDSLACGVVAISLGIALVLCFLLFFWIRIYILQTGYQILSIHHGGTHRDNHQTW